MDAVIAGDCDMPLPQGEIAPDLPSCLRTSAVGGAPPGCTQLSNLTEAATPVEFKDR